MLRGIKPLAKFVDVTGRYPDVVLRYLRLFDRHVEHGRMIRRDVFAESDKLDLHHIYFVLPGEEWRIDAMMALLARPGKWSREREREEGALLGYTDAQNDIWLSQYYKGPD